MPSQLDASIDLRGDKDFFAFQVFYTGVVSIRSEGSTDTVGTLFNYNLDTVKSDSNSGSEGNFDFSSQLPPGTYYLRVTGQGDNETRGDYSLFIEGDVGPTPDLSSAIDLTPIVLLLLID